MTTTPPETSTITLTVDGALVSARQGAALLEVLREHGATVPTLCDLEGVSEAGACRLCLVEVADRPRPQAACVTAAAEGMVVQTDSAALRGLRLRDHGGRGHGDSDRDRTASRIPSDDRRTPARRA